MEARVLVVGVNETAYDLRKTAEIVPAAVADALKRGGEWVTYEARDRLRPQITGTYLPHYPKTISSEVVRGGGAISMIVGPRSDRPQGGMGPGVEFGSSHTKPHPHLFDAFDARVESILDRVANNIGQWPR